MESIAGPCVGSEKRRTYSSGTAMQSGEPASAKTNSIGYLGGWGLGRDTHSQAGPLSRQVALLPSEAPWAEGWELM